MNDQQHSRADALTAATLADARSALYGIAKTYDDSELRAKALEAYEATFSAPVEQPAAAPIGERPCVVRDDCKWPACRLDCIIDSRDQKAREGKSLAELTAPSPADERAAWDRTRHSLAVAMCGFATRSGSRDLDAAISVLDAITEAESPLSWLRTARAASANETGAEGAKPIYQLQQVNGAWRDVTESEYRSIGCNYARVVYAAPQPSQADAQDVPADDLVGFVYVLENPDRPHDPVTRFSRRPLGVRSLGAKIRSVTPVYSRPAQAAMPALTNAMRAVITNESGAYQSADDLYAALCAAADDERPAQADARDEDAYVVKRLSEVLADVYTTLIGDDKTDADANLNAIQRVQRAAQVLRLEVDLYRGQADARKGLKDEQIDKAMPEPDGSAEVDKKPGMFNGTPGYSSRLVDAWSRPLVHATVRAILQGAGHV